MDRMLTTLALLVLPLAVQAGEVFGTIRTGTGPVGEGAQVEATCGDKAYGPVATDKRGAYRIVIDQIGKCTLSVTHEAKTASIEVVSFESAAQADVVLKVDSTGKLTATRG
jgi:hypothetical protein